MTDQDKANDYRDDVVRACENCRDHMADYCSMLEKKLMEKDDEVGRLTDEVERLEGQIEQIRQDVANGNPIGYWRTA